MPTLHPPSSTARVEVPEASVDHYLSQGWSSAGVSAPEPQAEDGPEDAPTCDDCGFEAKSNAGLTAHARKHDDEE